MCLLPAFCSNVQLETRLDCCIIAPLAIHRPGPTPHVYPYHRSKINHPMQEAESRLARARRSIEKLSHFVRYVLKVIPQILRYVAESVLCDVPLESDLNRSM